MTGTGDFLSIVYNSFFSCESFQGGLNLPEILLSTGILFLGAIVSLTQKGRTASLTGAASAVLGSALLFHPAYEVLATGKALSFYMPWGLPLASFSFRIDALSAFFLVPIAVLSICAAVYGVQYLEPEEKHRNTGAMWCCFNLMTASMVLTVTAYNGLLFLLAWEVTALSSFFLVIFEHEREQNKHAGWVYLIASHLGAAFILVLFLMLGAHSATLDFGTFKAGAASASVIFILAVTGFGAKAGFIPLHVWLPEAHPAAPSHVSAMMSAVMIKMGIYGVLRITQILIALDGGSTWWGFLFILIGASSGILGVLFALAQHDLKRLLAYHSVENIGIITLGIGMGLLGYFYGTPLVALSGLAGALFHVLNHALFKGLLFLGAGAVAQSSGTREIDALGGLLKRMPVTGTAFLVGSMSISGLPPFNGFISEFLIYFSAFAALVTGGPALIAPSLIVILSLALIGGLAAACFAKAFSVVFLGLPRKEKTAEREVGWLMRAPMIALALCCVGAAYSSPLWIGTLVRVADSLIPIAPARVESVLPGLEAPLLMVIYVTLILVVLAVALALLRVWLLSGRQVSSAVTWDCGYVKPAARMQYTGSSFAQPIISLFRTLLPGKEKIVPIEGYFPDEGHFSTHTPDPFRTKVFNPLLTGVRQLYGKLSWVQHGILQAYVLYIVITLIALLIVVFI